jgi:hypothetical protein
VVRLQVSRITGKTRSEGAFDGMGALDLTFAVVVAANAGSATAGAAKSGPSNPDERRVSL